MAGTLITQLSSSNSQVHINYFDPLINQNGNFLALDIRKTGVYSGGYLTPVGNTTLNISNLSCEVQDSGGSGNQVRLVTTGSPISVPVSNTNPPLMVVLRWTYVANSSANYPSIYTVQSGSQNATDIVLGTAIYSGPTLSADYGATSPTFRSDPAVFDLFLKTEPVTSMPYAMTSGVVLRAGRACYGTSTFQIPTQVVPVSASVGTSGYYQVVLLQVSSTGVVSTSLSPYGVASASLPATPPSYNGLLTLAEITVQYTGSIYYIVAIKDVRCFANSGVTLNNLLPSQTGNSGKPLVTNGTNPSWAQVGAAGVSGIIGTPTPKSANTLYGPTTTDGLVHATGLVYSANNSTPSGWRIDIGPTSSLGTNVVYNETQSSSTESYESGSAPVPKGWYYEASSFGYGNVNNVLFTPIGS